MRREMLPALSAAEGVWCAATGHSRSRGIAFHATVNRGGARTKGIGITSLLMEKIIGGVCSRYAAYRRSICYLVRNCLSCPATVLPVHGQFKGPVSEAMIRRKVSLETRIETPPLR